MKKIIAATLSISIVLTGCATASKDIVATYASPMQFQSYDCDQLASETQRIQARVTQLGGRLDTAASNDKAIAGVGMILFWPALFALGGTKQQEADYARLKGEYDAVQQSAILRKCPGMVASNT
jgi:outer membrane murein-binding lipoprotein Lpp